MKKWHHILAIIISIWSYSKSNIAEEIFFFLTLHWILNYIKNLLVYVFG